MFTFLDINLIRRYQLAIFLVLRDCIIATIKVRLFLICTALSNNIISLFLQLIASPGLSSWLDIFILRLIDIS